ncbi:unnamed protein product [Trifolium pratense]|uniref:Uncharacterized protein n=1 Tax=Trifolium pratense TaxID=57577 RepID=A0ACB0ITX9_TRIPR|nr:unnamed protein product [Trifolium pratense]
MATNSVQEKQNHPKEEPEEHEEALSLCDLPLSPNQLPTKEEQHSHINEKQEEFNFHSWVGFFSTEPKMCVADEVFFQGQILPSRFSFSSEAGLLTTKSLYQQHDGKQFNSKFNQCKFNEFRSNSSTSQNSNTSTSTSSTTTPIVSNSISSKSKVRNQFHTHPSPKPQLKSSCPRKSITQTRKSSVWEIFRLGVVPTPEIELQDLKVRSSNKNCVSRNSSSSSSNNSTLNDKGGKMSKKNDVFKHFVGKRGGLLSGCDCSIETVKFDMVMNKGENKSGYNAESTRKHAMKEKVMEWKKQKQRQKQGKKVMSRRRTFEWLKELHANHVDEEALLSNPS